MAVLGCLEVDWAVKAQLTDDDTGSQIEVVANNGNELVRGLVGGAVAVDIDGQGFGHTNGIGQLDQGAAGKPSSDERLGNPATNVGSGAVDLGEILTREGTTTVGTPATIGVDDYLAASQTSVTLGTTNDEETGGLDLFRL